ncbi:hypothetical protein TgHK011_007700 [Trichoderma gracile]|nr:hypothetical protein TgHK011_007700 [Trichoderma gracile]
MRRRRQTHGHDERGFKAKPSKTMETMQGDRLQVRKTRRKCFLSASGSCEFPVMFGWWFGFGSLHRICTQPAIAARALSGPVAHWGLLWLPVTAQKSILPFDWIHPRPSLAFDGPVQAYRDFDKPQVHAHRGNLGGLTYLYLCHDMHRDGLPPFLYT